MEKEQNLLSFQRQRQQQQQPTFKLLVLLMESQIGLLTLASYTHN